MNDPFPQAPTAPPAAPAAPQQAPQAPPPDPHVTILNDYAELRARRDHYSRNDPYMAGVIDARMNDLANRLKGGPGGDPPPTAAVPANPRPPTPPPSAASASPDDAVFAAWYARQQQLVDGGHTSMGLPGSSAPAPAAPTPSYAPTHAVPQQTQPRPMSEAERFDAYIQLRSQGQSVVGMHGYTG